MNDTDDNPSEQDLLLKALKAGNGSEIDRLARALFKTHNGDWNWVEIDSFRSFAPCKIYPKKVEHRSAAVIIYNGVQYLFG